MNTVRPKEILLVKDSPIDVMLTVEAFKNLTTSYNLHVVRDGEEALAFLRRGSPHQSAPRPDLILLDVNLPKIGGLEVLAEIKSDTGLKQIPVVVLTTSESAADINRAYGLARTAISASRWTWTSSKRPSKPSTDSGFHS